VPMPQQVLKTSPLTGEEGSEVSSYRSCMMAPEHRLNTCRVGATFAQHVPGVAPNTCVRTVGSRRSLAFLCVADFG
jgi:hypothetical protein